MRYFFIFIILFFVSLSASAQAKKYFDADNKPITEEQFNEQLKDPLLRRLTTYPSSDRINYLYRPSEKGKLSGEETAKLYTYFSSISGQELDRTAPIIIHYYQGPDPCNLSGTADEDLRKTWYRKLAVTLNRIVVTNILVVYSNADNVQKKYPGMPVYFDKDGVLNKFFNNHYPCSSAFILNPNNNYGCIRGEYSKEGVIRVFEEIRKGNL